MYIRGPFLNGDGDVSTQRNISPQVSVQKCETLGSNVGKKGYIIYETLVTFYFCKNSPRVPKDGVVF